MGAFGIRNATINKIMSGTDTSNYKPTTIPPKPSGGKYFNELQRKGCPNECYGRPNETVAGITSVLKGLGRAGTSVARLVNTCNSAKQQPTIVSTTNSSNTQNTSSIQSQITNLRNLYGSKYEINYDDSTKKIVVTNPKTMGEVCNGSYDEVTNYLSNHNAGSDS